MGGASGGQETGSSGQVQVKLISDTIQVLANICGVRVFLLTCA